MDLFVGSQNDNVLSSCENIYIIVCVEVVTDMFISIFFLLTYIHNLFLNNYI